jgi:endonuclease III
LAAALGEVGSAEGLPFDNQRDPLDELIYIILTTMTQYGPVDVFRELKSAFPSWDLLLRPRSEPKLRQIVAICGLVNQKAPQILAIARQLKKDFGAVTLEPLRAMPDEECEAYLVSLPRVGKKVARCVMMYSLNRQVLPVDTHVLRLAKRLGLLPYETSWAKAHDAIHEVVPRKNRYSVHVGLVTHGREVCLHKNPRCETCQLVEMCVERRTSPAGPKAD